MKKLSLLFLFIALVQLVIADVAESRDQFIKGNMLYEKGDFEQAIAHYERAGKNSESFELYYNLGNAYFKTAKIPYAILNYERALKLNPTDLDTQYNLKLANSLTKDKIEKLPELNITQWWRSFTLSMSVDTWAWLTVGFMIGAVLLFVLFMLFNSRLLRMLSFYTGLVLVLLCFASYNRASAAQNIVQENTEAIIFTPKVDVKSAPTADGVNVFILHEGTKVKVLQTQGEWLNVRISSGNEGWINQSNCELI